MVISCGVSSRVFHVWLGNRRHFEQRFGRKVSDTAYLNTAVRMIEEWVLKECSKATQLPQCMGSSSQRNGVQLGPMDHRGMTYKPGRPSTTVK